MARPKVSITLRRVNASTCVIDIEGAFTGFAEDTLMDAYSRVSAGKTRTIILNFGGLDHMNSTGIGLLVTLLIRIQRQNQELMAVGLSDHYRQILSLTRLDEAIVVYPTEAQALAAAV